MWLLKNDIDIPFLKLGILAVTLAIGLTACDLLVEDVLPRSDQDEAVLDSEGVSIQVRAEEQFLLDLRTVVQANTDLELSIVEEPEFGVADIQDQRWLSYLANANFPGEDFLVIAAKRGEEVLDQDTLRISAPPVGECSSAALPFTWVGSLSEPLIVYELPLPVEPDSCFPFDPMQGGFEILTPPEVGNLQVVGSQFLYEPGGDSAYTVRAVFQQCIGGTCAQGILTIQMEAAVPCQLLAQDDFLEIRYAPDSLFSTHVVDVLANDSLCGKAVEIAVLSGPSGTQWYVDSGKIVIEVYEAPSSSAQLVYMISDSAGLDTALAVINISFVEECRVIANDDFYNIRVDSVAEDTVNYFIDVLFNDAFCNIQQVDLQITQAPTLGTATVDDMGVIYSTVPNMELLFQADTLHYRICEGFVCDSASVIIQYE
ncbi:MAG TPA: hypothetical protein DCE41_25385 [Cytophagales bacterium]|nr:hypothetical protein [Cytophagales bacterium]HAA17246.1 hypothetical protein [Cytophagales bacterium]HAP61692.1 hypothetical protein [Cytophagales bacterium]